MDILIALSLARTGLDDPGQVFGQPVSPERQISFAIDKIDEAMRLLDVELRPALALTTTAKLIAEIADNLGATTHSDGTKRFVPAWQQDAADRLHQVLDVIDLVIEVVNSNGEEE